MGIRVTHSGPGQPEGTGKIERIFRSVREQFLVEVHGQADNPVGHYAADLAAMQEALRLWASRVYHRQVHSQTGQPPADRWDDGDPGPLPDPQTLRAAFAWTVTRRVRKTARVELEGNVYLVDRFLVGRFLVGRDVQLHYDPFNLSDIEVFWAGQLVGKAVPQHIGRHAHPKAPPENEPEPITPTGIDYIQLLADADRAETSQRLNLAHLAEGAEPADTGEQQADQR